MKPTRIMIKIITDGTIMRMMVRDELLLGSCVEVVLAKGGGERSAEGGEGGGALAAVKS